MVPASFDYHRATSVAEAIELLGRYEDAKLLAGGHSLIPMMKLRLAQPGALIDVGRIAELAGVERRGDAVVVGALTPHAEIAASRELAAACPLLAEAAATIGDPAVRNKGTIGGNIAHADPASDLPAVLVAAEATIRLAGPDGERAVVAGDFFVGLLTTDLGPREIVTAIEIPALPAGGGSAYRKVEHPASGYAVCGAAAIVVRGDDGSASRVRLAFNGIAATPWLADDVAGTLEGGDLSDDALAGALAGLEIDEPLADAYASGDYRVRLARVHGRRALAAARDRAGEGRA